MPVDYRGYSGIQQLQNFPCSRDSSDSCRSWWAFSCSSSTTFGSTLLKKESREPFDISNAAWQASQKKWKPQIMQRSEDWKAQNFFLFKKLHSSVHKNRLLTAIHGHQELFLSSISGLNIRKVTDKGSNFSPAAGSFPPASGGTPLRGAARPNTETGWI